jgi:iron-sulfur cluster repair protein YtfE (RIC family)
MKPEELAHWISEEHQKVRELAGRLRECVVCVPRTNHEKWLCGVREAFEHLRAHLTKHMSLEENEGYMVSVVEQRPALSREVERLAHEHGEFIRLMNDIHQHLLDLQPQDQLLIRDSCHRLRDLLSYVEHHKNEENLLVSSVFNLDIGAGE